MGKILDKVSAFITRQQDGQQELLVFRQNDPLAGVQVPAGTVEPGETLEQAVLRETYEESGLKVVRIIQQVDSFEHDLPDGMCVLLQKTMILQEPSREAPPLDLGLDRGFLIQRGWYLRMHEEYHGWTRVTYETEDLSAGPPFEIVRTTGWVPTELLTTRLARHIYHLLLLASAPARWELFAEGRYLFRLYWVPLVPRPQLVEAQDEWLEHSYAHLLRYTEA